MNMYNQELYHHGIINMHWGQRNGPPYPLSNAQKTSAEKKAEENSKNKKSDSSDPKPGVKSANEMSMEELREAVQRAELIKKYNDLQPKEKKSIIKKGAEFVGKQFGKASDNIGGQIATYVLGSAVNRIGKELFNIDSMVNPKKGQKDK